MRLLFGTILLVVIVTAGCSAPVRISAYPGEEVASHTVEQCKLEHERVKVLGSLPETGTYIEIGYMTVSQESASEFRWTSEEKQIEKARIQACQWGADAIVLVGSSSDKGSDFWTGYKDVRETRIVAIKFK